MLWRDCGEVRGPAGHLGGGHGLGRVEVQSSCCDFEGIICLLFIYLFKYPVSSSSMKILQCASHNHILLAALMVSSNF